jgi:hypothetical protein
MTGPREAAAWAALVLLFAGGCRSERNVLDYRLGQKGGSAALTLEDTTILFEGVPAAGPDQEKARGWLQVSGPGTSSGSFGAAGLTLSFSYAQGVNAVAIGNYGFKIIAGGRRLRFSKQTFPIDGKKTILVAKDGSARLEG